MKNQNCPFLVACSAFVDKKIEENALISGFDHII
jgi:hypothetical protein